MATLTWGPWIGPPTPDGVANVTAKADVSCRLAVSLASNMASPVYFGPSTPNASSVVSFTPTGLLSHTQYYCQIELAGTLTGTIGKFRTAPGVLVPTNMRVAFGSCNGAAGTSGAPSAYSNTPLFDMIRAKDPDVFCHLGDLSYSDIITNDVSLFRAMYDGVFAQPKLAAIQSSQPWAYGHSDHDSGPNSVDKTFVGRPAFRQAFQECTPHPPLQLGTTGDVPPWFEFAWGRIRFFFPDNRGERDATTGLTTEEVGRSRYGATQKAYLKQRLLAARETLLIVNTETPWIGKPDPGSDSWTGYTRERRELAQWFVANHLHKRLMFIAGDGHFLAFDSGDHNYEGCGIPVLQAAPFDQTSNSFSGPYDTGLIVNPVGTGQYGILDIVDNGGPSITWTATGYRVTP